MPNEKDQMGRSSLHLEHEFRDFRFLTSSGHLIVISFPFLQEPHANGPLFTELAFYQRVAKPELSMSLNFEFKKTVSN